MNKLIIAAFVLSLSIQSCYYDNEEELYPQSGNCDTAAITYSGKIAPMVASRCALSGCHGAGSMNGDFSSHATFSAFLDTKKANLVESINFRGPKPMPQGGVKMPACDIQHLETWINNGYPNN
ncbi:MAG TPA: hypothetical protein VEC12_04095 [Bacteroidia bacterium]|nr:hypothetical protein [Bacteroidia bacterium]